MEMRSIYNFGLAIIVVLLTATGCSIDKIDTWNSLGYVWFSTQDTITFTFAAHDDSMSYTVNLPLTLAGKTEKYDRELNVEIAEQVRNDSTKLEVIRPVIIPADSTSGYVKVRIQKTDNLYHNRDTVRFKITSSDNLLKGLEDNLYKTLIVYNRFVKPDWWTVDTEYVIGRYTELKLSIIYKVLGDNITEDPVPRFGSPEIRVLNVYKLNKYLEDFGPFYDFDGMEVKFAWGIYGY